MKKMKTIDIFTKVASMFLVMLIVCFAWIGAEYALGDEIGLGKVDYFFAAYVALSLIRKINDIEKQLAKAKRVSHTAVEADAVEISEFV